MKTTRNLLLLSVAILVALTALGASKVGNDVSLERIIILGHSEKFTLKDLIQKARSHIDKSGGPQPVDVPVTIGLDCSSTNLISVGYGNGFGSRIWQVTIDRSGKVSSFITYLSRD